MSITVTQKQFDRIYLIRAACDSIMTVKQVAVRLKLTERRVKQLKADYRQKGDKAFQHGNTGRAPVNKISSDVRQKITSLKTSENYSNANIAHYRDLLCKHEGINYSYQSVYNILSCAGFKSPKAHGHITKRRHLSRPRREHFGELLQADASPYDWLGIGKRTALHGYIDDATGRVTGLYMCENECLLGYLEVTRQTLCNHGIPLELYPDRATVFFVTDNTKNNLTIDEQLEGMKEKKTQLGKIMDELGVNMYPAYSPEAKGRIERLWQTLQSRLPVEFKIRKIKTLAEANKFLESYIEEHNSRFAVPPAQTESAFVPLCDKEILDTLLSVRIERRTNSAGEFSFHKYKFLVDKKDCRDKKITLLISERFGFKVQIGKEKQLYDIKHCDFFNNRHLKTNMPQVTKKLIEQYLYTNAKKKTSRHEYFSLA